MKHTLSRPMLLFGLIYAVVTLACCTAGGVAAGIVLHCTVFVLILFALVKPLRGYLHIPVACTAAVLASVVFLLFTAQMLAPLEKYEAESSFNGKIVSLPVIKNGRCECDIETEYIGDEKAQLTLRCSFSTDVKIHLYDVISVSQCKIYVPKNPDGTQSESDLAGKVYLRAYSYTEPIVLFEGEPEALSPILHLRSYMTDVLLKSLPEDCSGLAVAMLLGDKSYVTPEQYDSFSDSGASHLLAVSGLHVSVWVSVLLAILHLFIRNERVLNALGLAFLPFFAALTAFSPSVSRASLMYALILSCVFFGRRADSLNSLGFAVFIVLLFNPYAVLSLSLRLSVSAVFGILTLGKYMCSFFQAKLTAKTHNRYARMLYTGIIDIFMISVAATVSTLPVAVSAFGKISLIAPLTNIAVIWLSSCVMILSAAGVLLSLPFIPHILADAVFSLCGVTARLVARIVEFFGSFRFSALPVEKQTFSIWLLLSCVIIAACVYVCRRKKSYTPVRLVGALCCVVLLFNCTLALHPFRDGVKLRVLNTRNGAGVLLSCGYKNAIIECAGDKYEMYYYLREALPQSPVYETDLYLLHSTGYMGCREYVEERYSPVCTAVNYEYYSSYKELMNGDEYVNDYHRFTLWDEINVTYLNKSGLSCVIIDSGETQAVISLTENNSASAIARAAPSPDCLVCVGGVPAGIDGLSAGEIIIAGQPIHNNNNYPCAVDGEYTFRFR